MPSNIEKQNEVKILSQENLQVENIFPEPNPKLISEQNQKLKEDSTTETVTENVTSDLQTILTYGGHSR